MSDVCDDSVVITIKNYTPTRRVANRKLRATAAEFPDPVDIVGILDITSVDKKGRVEGTISLSDETLMSIAKPELLAKVDVMTHMIIC